MIPYDRYTIAVINLLIFLGLMGIFKPTWFIILSRFPFIFPLSKHPPITETRRKHARVWGALSVAGAFLLMFLATG